MLKCYLDGMCFCVALKNLVREAVLETPKTILA